MTEYKPKLRKRGLNPPFGYYPSPNDDDIMLPDIKLLEALEHSFRMRAKYKTPIRDCCMWLQANTGKSITPAGYYYAYKNWIKKIKQARGREINKISRKIYTDKQKYIQDHFSGFTININDDKSVYAVAESKAKDIEKKQATG